MRWLFGPFVASSPTAERDLIRQFGSIGHTLQRSACLVDPPPLGRSTRSGQIFDARLGNVSASGKVLPEATEASLRNEPELLSVCNRYNRRETRLEMPGETGEHRAWPRGRFLYQGFF